jgi:threonine aldolase
LTDVASHFHLRVQMDGARFANAVASLGVTPKEITWKAGVDVLCFGGTKNGIAVGEAVVFFNRELAKEFDYRCKQGGQLASKMRYLSAPWVGMLQDGAWLRHASHSNGMAKRLESGIRKVSSVKIVHPVQTNVVFAKIPDKMVEGMHERGWKFYTHVGSEGEARLMCSWDTTAEDVDEFTADLADLEST